MSTPAPKAIIVAIIGFLRLTKDARIAPAIKGMLATKPHRSESNKVPADGVTMHFLHYLLKDDGEKKKKNRCIISINITMPPKRDRMSDPNIQKRIMLTLSYTER
jgi:hypothetical protein